MNKWIVVICLTVASLGSVSSAFAAVETSADAYVSVNSMYLWRGFDLSPDDAFVVQPGADVGIGGFTLSWWGNLSENSGEMNEVDLTVDYSFDLSELVSVSVGNILYDVDNALLEDAETGEILGASRGTTNEAYLGIAFNTLLSPAVTVFYDYDEFDGNIYTVVSAGHSIDLLGKAALNLGASASYFSLDAEDESFFHNAEFSASMDLSLNDQISITPLVIYSMPISDEAEDIAGIDDELMAGLTATFSF